MDEEHVEQLKLAIQKLEMSGRLLATLEERSTNTIRRLSVLEAKLSNGIEDRMRAVEKAAAINTAKLALTGGVIAGVASLTTALLFGVFG